MWEYFDWIYEYNYYRPTIFPDSTINHPYPFITMTAAKHIKVFYSTPSLYQEEGCR